jgi:hypothetical protein
MAMIYWPSSLRTIDSCAPRIIRQGISDLASETVCVSSAAKPSRSKRKDFRQLVNKQGGTDGCATHILECACNDVDDKVAMALIHAFFSENIDDGL